LAKESGHFTQTFTELNKKWAIKNVNFNVQSCDTWIWVGFNKPVEPHDVYNLCFCRTCATLYWNSLLLSFKTGYDL